MTTNAKIGMGTTLKFSTDAGATWWMLPEATKIGVPQTETDWVEATHLNSLGWKEYIVGLKDGGEIEIEGNYVKADAVKLRSFGDVLVSVKVTLTDLSVCDFKAYVIPAVGDITVGDIITMSAKLRISGAPVWA